MNAARRRRSAACRPPAPVLLSAAALAFLLGLSCSAPPPPPAAATKAAARPERPLSPAAIAYNDTARFIAGLPGRPGSPFEAMEKDPAWVAYSNSFAETWSQYEKTQAEPVRAFEQRELAPGSPKGTFVFYPFSGPDVLYMMGFFPGRSTYVMIGLEPPGTVGAPSDFKPEKIAVEMKNWSAAMQSIFRRSFFVTSEMDRAFRGRVADGLIESICLLLARSGYTIEEIRHGDLTDEGVFTPVDLAALAAQRDARGKPRKPKGVEVTFRQGPAGDPRKIFYFATPLDKEFKTKPGFSRFLTSLGEPDTLIKSASFVMHWSTIDAFRQQVLNSSRLILQDDTGVPFRMLQPPAWTVKLYGEYSRPDRPFRNWYQKSLADAFSEPSRVSPLGFSLGYGAYRRPSSMMLARRTGAAAPAPASVVAKK